MNELFKWLASNSLAANTLIVSFGIVVLSTASTYLIAFFQGREISFWPPKIGPKTSEKHASGNEQPISHPTIVYRSDLPRLETFISEAEDEIWISGIDLNVIVNYIDSFIDRIQQGVRIKLLAINLDNALTNEISEFRAIELNDLLSRCKANFSIIQKRLVKMYPEKVEFRAFPHRPSVGYFVIDPHSTDRGKMNVGLYMYQRFSTDEPLLHIIKKSSTQLFEFYLKDFETMWNASSELSENDYG